MAAQILICVIFVAMFALIVTEKIERHYTTLACGALTLILVFGICMQDWGAIWSTLNLESFFHKSFWIATSEGANHSGINWETILFIAGMMVMVEGMARVGFFRWLCMCLAKLVHYRTMSIFVTFMLMSFVLAMFIDSITVILFLAAVTVELSKLLKFNPTEMVLAEIFCANLGGSATMCGDPPNIIIGTSLGYTFFDFLLNTGLVAIVSLVFIVLFYYFSCRKEYGIQNADVDISSMPAPSSAIVDKKGFIASSVIFGLAVILLVTHSMTGLTVSTIGLFIAVLTLITSWKYIPELIKKVDYKTLLFFVGLFVVVGGLEQTGVLELIAALISKISGGNAMLMVAIIIWVSAIASAFVDNIPFAATMIPVIESLSATSGIALPTLSWALAMGTDVGGSATPIGASANVVGTSVIAKAGHPVGWGKYCKKSVPATAIVLIISTVIIFVRYL